jgi:hypothetical protein
MTGGLIDVRKILTISESTDTVCRDDAPRLAVNAPSFRGATATHLGFISGCRT